MTRGSAFARSGFILFALFFASVLAFLDRQLLNILVRPIRADTGISDVQFSVLQGAAFALVYFAVAFPIAALSDRVSRKKVILISIGAWSLMTFLFGLADSFALLLLARMGVAIGEAGLSPASISILRQVYPRERQSFAVALLTLSVYFGGGISMVIGGPALGALEAASALPFGLAPWRLLFVGCAVIGGIGVFLVALMREPAHAPGNRAEGSTAEFLRLMKAQRGRVATYLIAFIALNALFYGVAAWTPALFMRSHGWSAQQTGLGYGMVYMLGGVAGALLGGRLVGRLMRGGMRDPAVVVLRGAALLVGAATTLSALAPNGAVALAAAGVAMIGIGTIVALGSFAFQALFPAQFSARAVAVYFLIPGTLGASLGPSAVPMLAEALGEREDIAIGLAVCASALSLWAVLWLSGFLRIPFDRDPGAAIAAAGA